MTVIAASTLAAFVMDDPDTWGAWLYPAEQILDDGQDVQWFAALEVDGRGLEPFAPLLDRFAAINTQAGRTVCHWWTYMLDDGRTEVTTANRLRHITMGQNLATDFTLAAGASHMLFLAADLEPPWDAIPRLLEVDWPLVGGHVPTYCLDGPPVAGYPFPVHQHMATAAFVLIARPLLRFVRWRWDVDAGMSDDPCLHHDAAKFHGIETRVRHDVVGRHHPEAIGPVETRGHDMRVVRP